LARQKQFDSGTLVISTLVITVVPMKSRVKHELRLLVLAGVLFSVSPSFGAEPAGENQALFWQLWGLLAETAKACNTEDNTRSFLDTAGMVVDDPEHSKVFSNVVESLAMEKPQCFLSAANSQNPRELQTMIEHFLAHPKFHSSMDIEASLQKYWGHGAYAKIHEVYLDARHERSGT
jgi:hypothetical protein